MRQNIVEYLRQCSIEKLFKTDGFANSWPVWKAEINKYAPVPTESQILALGDRLRDIFRTTSIPDRSQAGLSSGGSNWEGLVCWYLNLCSIGRRTVVIKHIKELIPEPVADAILVNYGSFPSSTEADLIAITFPDKQSYCIDKSLITITDVNGNQVPVKKSPRARNYNLIPVLNALVHHDFGEIEIHIIQCKTNWNDNAQIPMLWDMIYSTGNVGRNIRIGNNGYVLSDAKSHSYSFVTVPTVRLSNFKTSSLSVKRVSGLTGGNYWGLESKDGVASSVKEMLNRNLRSGHNGNHLSTIRNELNGLSTIHSYFGL